MQRSFVRTNSNGMTWMEWLDAAEFGESHKMVDLLQAWKDGQNPKDFVKEITEEKEAKHA